jgi:A/G-specific adenine glycosylase
LLLDWFSRSRRDLPWRQDRDPYRIWVSEIMLQQTQVATVIPYFNRFLKAFPSVAALAAADLQDVLRLWEGLGYYRRARDLHRAARQIVLEYGSRIPDDRATLQTLPGIGRYTMGAILSQAFDQRLPILEANSQRVLSRLFGRADDPRSGQARDWLWKAAEALLPARQAGEFNQALMELGALVCFPVAPECSACPLTKLCVARRLGLQAEIPRLARTPEAILVQEAAVVVRRGAQVLLVQRSAQGRWAGLWEFPHAPLAQGEGHEEAAARLLADLTGIEAVIGAELLTLRHSVTHHRITLVCFQAAYRAGRFRSGSYQQGRWLRLGQLADYPVSAPQRRLALELLQPARQQRLF